MSVPVIQRKFAAPVLPQPHLSRGELLERLSAGLAPSKRVTLVRGGPGTGKTTLLAEYARWVPAIDCWYGLMPADEDSAVFFRHLVAGLARRLPDLSGQAAAALDSLGSAGYEQAIGLLCDDLMAVLDAPLVLIVDDAHLLPTGPEALRALETFIRFFPDDSQLVLSGRSLPPIKLAGGLLRGEVLAVEEADLRFSHDEVAAFLTAIRGEVTAETVELVHGRTLGWPAGVAYFSSAQPGEAPRQIEHPELLFAYLSEEILDTLDSSFRLALLESAFLPRLDQDACTALPGGGADAFLEQIRTFTPFVLPDGDGLVFQPIFRDFLQREYGRRTPPAAQREFFRMLAEQTGQAPEDAVALFLGAEEWKAAEERLLETFRDLADSGRTETLLALLRRFPSAWARRSAASLYMQGEIERRHGRLAEAIRLLQRADSLAAEELGAARRGSCSGRRALGARIWASLAAAHGARGDLEEQIVFARKALSALSLPVEEPAEEPVDASARESAEPAATMDWPTAAFALNALGLAFVFRHQLEAAHERFRQVLALYRRHGDDAGQIRILHNQGLAHAKAGDFERAIAAYEDAVRQAATVGRPPLALTLNNLALCHLHMGRPAQAWRSFEQGMALAERGGSRGDRVLLLRTLGYLHLNTTDSAKAREAFEASLSAVGECGDRLGRALAAFGLAEEALIGGDLARARARLEQGLEDAGRPLQSPEMIEGTLLAIKLEIAAGSFDRASELLAGVDALLARAPNHFQCFIAARLTANLANARGQAEDASSAGRRMAELAVRYGYSLPPDQEPAASSAPAGKETATATHAPAVPALPPIVEVRTLGPFEVIVEGTSLAPRDWRSGNAKLVLAFLLLHPQGATKERLIELLYPRKDPGRSALPTVINRLRQALEPDAGKGAPSRFIHFQEGRYLFTRGVRSNLDVAELRTLVGRAREAGNDHARCRALLERAVALYRGSFMEDFPDLPWCQIERENIRRLAMEAYEELFGLLAAADEWPDVERAAEACLAVEPAAQVAQRAKIVTLAMQERFADALRFEAVAAGSLREDHGLEPDPETEALVEAIRDGRFTVRDARDFLPARW